VLSKILFHGGLKVNFARTMYSTQYYDTVETAQQMN